MGQIPLAPSGLEASPRAGRAPLQNADDPRDPASGKAVGAKGKPLSAKEFAVT